MKIKCNTGKMNNILGAIVSFVKTNTEFLIQYENGELAKLNILNNHVFKYYMSPTGDFLEYPTPNNPTDIAKINIKKLSDYDTEAFEFSVLKETEHHFIVYTKKISIQFDKIRGTMTVQDSLSNKNVLIEYNPLSYGNKEVKQTLLQHKEEYFFGGGMQNGRFSHKGKKISIVNSNNWVDGGVSSPNPFYWSTKGYGVLRNTWQPGVYDFGTENPEIVETTHEEEGFDAFFFISSEAKNILRDYYELTGQPIFLPEFAFYEAHLNAFNRDYWVKVDKDVPNAILFEDGFYYKCYQPAQINDKEGILESLNGEKDNYQFSARAMVDRYQRHDMPLGWFIPNDGYGSGYGQTDSFEGDIDNLKQFSEYAKSKGVETALWTESNLEPKDPEHPLKGERDLHKEVSVAGIVALKCDVAWIGEGYSFGLSAVEKAAHVFQKGAQQTHKARTVIIMVDGWAGTQRYAGIWTGDQKGGEWEYIRFHIPTYIGASLSGMPIVGSDMDGIYAGGDKNVYIRDYQWKTFTPLQLNMDGWGKVQKTPFAFDDEATLINRAYLKLKSMFMPYNYTIGYTSIHELPMIRAMFLEFPDDTCGYTEDSQYQYMWGPYLLVAPIFNEQCNAKGEWTRHNIYLPNPDQIWIDLMTGQKYQGGKIWNSIKTPLWKLPVFVKDGAIFPMVHPNNNPNEIQRETRIFNIYPNGESKFTVYEDDGISSEYLEGRYTKTSITVIGPSSNELGDLYIHIKKSEGSYENIVKDRSTLLRVMASENIKHIKAAINNETIRIPITKSEEEFSAMENTYYFNENYYINPYLKNIGDKTMKQKWLMIKIQKCDVTESDIHIKIKGFENKSPVLGDNAIINNTLKVPANFNVLDDDNTPTSISLQWDAEKDVYYEIERDGTLFTNITDTKFTFDGFQYESEHKFRIRSACNIGVSPWSYYITESTKQDPYKNVIKKLEIDCSVPSEPGQEICYLTDRNPGTLWHTVWDKPDEAHSDTGEIIINIDIMDIYKIDKIEYTTRDDAGNGTILQLKYRYSVDNNIWNPMSEIINWNRDNTVKTIDVEGREMRFIQINILNTVGGFGSGKHLLIYKKI